MVWVKLITYLRMHTYRLHNWVLGPLGTGCTSCDHGSHDHTNEEERRVTLAPFFQADAKET